MEVSDAPDVSSDDAGLSSLQNTSSDSLFCDPCKEDGCYYEAEGYSDCTHHLCQSCFQQHRTPRPMRHHKLVDRQEMPQTKPEKVFKDECTDKCSAHGDEILKYFCEDHNMFGCTVCVTLAHRTCKVEYIPTLSADLFNTEEYKSFKLALESIVRETICIQNTATRNLEDAKKNAEAVFVKIGHFRKEIDTFFDELENDISSNLTTLRDENQEAISEILKESEHMADKLKNIENKMKENEDRAQKCRLFVDMKQLDETICELKKDIGIMGKKNTIQELTFKPSDSVTSFIRNRSETFGSLVRFHERFPLEIAGYLFEDIAVLSRERIAIQFLNDNYCKKRIVLIDTTKMPTQVMTQIKSSITSGLTRVNENEIAVTDNGNIHIYSVTDNFVLKYTIKNTELYHSIVYTNGLFIGCTLTDPYILRVVNMNGDVMKTLSIVIGDDCYGPCYIAAHPDHKTIYVSDNGKQTVTCLTFEGEVKAEYTHGYEWQPAGVAVSYDGLVYVSDRKHNNIHILTSDLKPHDMIIGTKYGIRDPLGLAVCNKDRKLFVGMTSGESIRVFNI